MSPYRHIPKIELRGEVEPIVGEIGSTVWVDPAALLIDSRYQREIGRQSEKRIRDIARRFDWGKFAPLLVVRLEGSEVYAIIDGQHRAAAAAARGIDTVPAFVLALPLARQATTFLAINSEGARIASGALWHAKAAAGDREAIATLNLCQAAGVRVLKYPLEASQRKPTDTLAPLVIADMLKSHGFDVAKRTLEILVEAGKLRNRVMLTRVFVRALGLILKHNRHWMARPIHLFIADLEPQEVEAKARIQSRRTGESVAAISAAIIREAIQKGFK